jgi:hypothetical protein
MNRLKIVIPALRVYWLAQPSASSTAANIRTPGETRRAEPDTLPLRVATTPRPKLTSIFSGVFTTKFAKHQLEN